MFPKKGEYPEYFGHYLSQISPDEALSNILINRFEAHSKRFAAMTEAQLLHRYAEGKWSIKEIIGHLIDTERILTYRALRFARADETELPGFDENHYVPHGSFDGRPIESLLSEWESVRRATLTMVDSMDEDALARGGKANGLYCTVNALFYIVGAHQEHHINVINDRYLS